MEHLKSAAMRSDVEGSHEELEKELLEYLAWLISKIGRQLWEHSVRITTTKSAANLRVHRALVGRLVPRVVVRCE